jgi:bacterioferritin (cytochrome b1)
MGTSSWHSSDSTLVLSFQLPRSRSIPYSTLFENNSYLRMLNKLLQLELGSIEMYRRCSGCLQIEDQSIIDVIEAHRQQAKNLVNLIVYNRGIPEEKGFSLSPEIGMIAHGLGRHLGRSWAYRTSHGACLHIERMLERKYAAALAEAPYGDRGILNDHAKRTSNHIDWLATARPADLLE